MSTEPATQVPLLANPVSITEHPDRWPRQVLLRDGTPILLRPIRAADEPLLIEFHEALRERTVRLRYSGPFAREQRTAHERLLQVCLCDNDRDIAPGGQPLAERERLLSGWARSQQRRAGGDRTARQHPHTLATRECGLPRARQSRTRHQDGAKGRKTTSGYGILVTGSGKLLSRPGKHNCPPPCRAFYPFDSGQGVPDAWAPAARGSLLASAESAAR